jgi:hypothetical protein
MSNAEHLIENAVVYLIEDKEFEDFAKDEVNINMVKVAFKGCNTGKALWQIWEMAGEVCFSWFYDETFKQQRFNKN